MEASEGMKAANNLWGGMEEVDEVGNRFLCV